MSAGRPIRVESLSAKYGPNGVEPNAVVVKLPDVVLTRAEVMELVELLTNWLVRSSGSEEL